PDAALAAGLKPGKDGKAPTLDAGKRRAALVEELYDFVIERLRGYYAEQGFNGEQFEAVLAVAPASLADFDRRLRAVAEFGRRPEALSLAAAKSETAGALQAGDYTAVLTRLAQLQAPVDAFFDGVLVNAENPAVRANRL